MKRISSSNNGAKSAVPEECRTLKDILASQGLARPKLVDFLSVDAEAAEAGLMAMQPVEVGKRGRVLG